MSPTYNYTSIGEGKANVDIQTDKAKGQAYINSSPAAKAPFSGIAGNRTLEAYPELNKTASEIEYGTGGASIVCGRDRPSTKTTGYGGLGHTQCSSIDMVCGRMGPYVTEVDNDGNLVYANPDFRIDAARIYISQKTNVDENFGLTGGSDEMSTAMSAIAFKADEVRCIARNRIELVTGTDARNSQGDRQTATNGIDLIAGNDNSELQPLVKGNNLVDCLKDLGEQIEDLREILYSFLKYQGALNKQVTNHTHKSPFYGIDTSPSFSVMATGMKTNIQLGAQTELSIVSHQTNLAMWEENYLSPVMKTYINSPFNKTN